MAAIAQFVGFGSDRPATLRVALGAALRRTAAARYAEQRDRIARTGIAGMI
ncbi:hypothetical protein Q8W71_29325 [Methylobacterium sp. NEAU 140]|uniref:hypothetical protein n=1 Tax=Methylobacterium sp. NEAU 140 TaxID=3064945 RepID=UPI0027361375|nr:hypothetical protein [Methylobacterium sp. NEAU 140]MDP4026712.1 hypothetical protein [Methylobacterium sp. NEAU 140]